MLGLIIDLDGTVYRGDRLVPGSDAALHRLRAAGHRVVFATNKSVARTKDHVDKLTALGVRADPDDLVTVNEVLARHLRRRLGPGQRVLVVGEAPLHEELADAGLSTTSRWDRADAVAMGWDRNLDYAAFNAAFQAAGDDARDLVAVGFRRGRLVEIEPVVAGNQEQGEPARVPALEDQRLDDLGDRAAALFCRFLRSARGLAHAAHLDCEPGGFRSLLNPPDALAHISFLSIAYKFKFKRHAIIGRIDMLRRLPRHGLVIEWDVHVCQNGSPRRQPLDPVQCL